MGVDYSFAVDSVDSILNKEKVAGAFKSGIDSFEQTNLCVATIHCLATEHWTHYLSSRMQNLFATLQREQPMSNSPYLAATQFLPPRQLS